MVEVETRVELQAVAVRAMAAVLAVSREVRAVAGAGRPGGARGSPARQSRA